IAKLDSGGGSYKRPKEWVGGGRWVAGCGVKDRNNEDGTKILVTVDGKLRTVFESSIRRNLKLNDEAGFSSLPDAELFENLQLMGYNILC
nr:hypothetical protein [Tanacetum cinerariifolium]